MFKLIKTELYDGFQCAMAACPDNCCDENWNIEIDEDTYGKYLSGNIDHLEDKISAEKPHMIIKDSITGKCPFITAEGLCTLHAQYGEEYLSNTCRSYPRFVTDYGPVITETLGLSCPAVARSLLELDHVLHLEEEVFFETREEVGKPYEKTTAEQRMQRCITMFHESQRDVVSCLTACLSEMEGGSGIEYPKSSNDMEKTASLLAEIYPHLEKNIAVSYLFEHLMLETLNPSPDYRGVICECRDILYIFRQELSETMQEDHLPGKEDIIRTLYRLMRVRDH